MQHSKWEMYLAISRKVETGGRNSDGNEDPAILDEHRRFVELFRQHLLPDAGGRPARVLAPGAMSEALLLCEAGYEVHAAVLGPDNVRWLEDRRQALPRPELLIARELDAQDLDYPAKYFDGYFSVQVHEHWIAPHVHIGEVRYCSRDGAVVFVDACGVTNEACKMIWHTNLVPERTVLEQWEFWGYAERWRGPHGDQRPQFVLEQLPMGDPRFKNAGYLQHVLAMRGGEPRQYEYSCRHCRR